MSHCISTNLVLPTHIYVVLLAGDEKAISDAKSWLCYGGSKYELYSVSIEGVKTRFYVND
jgi:hypothetical protein